MSQISHKQMILSAATKILSDSQALRNHMRKTKPCHYAHNCKHLSECGDAHFLEEYRIPMCLFLEFCQKGDCKMYHPHLGAPHEYISFMGINKVLLSRQEWENKRHTYNSARAFMADKERLRQHIYRTRACPNGAECKNKEGCQNAHFLEEYRIPICLFLNFCDEADCHYFHPTREAREKFLSEKAPTFKYVNYEEYCRNVADKEKRLYLVRPLVGPNPLAVASPVKMAGNARTKFCSFVKDKKMCAKMGCTYAHSVEELVNGYEMDIPRVFMRPAHKNSIERKMEWEQMKIFRQLQAEENGEKVEEDENDQIEEVLEEIENEIEDVERHKEDFLREVDGMEELDEFDEGVVFETFTYPAWSAFGEKYNVEKYKFCWADDDSEEYYEGDQE